MAGIKKGAELRQKIIDTAWGLFYENGYENTTVNDIIRKVGRTVSPAATVSTVSIGK